MSHKEEVSVVIQRVKKILIILIPIVLILTGFLFNPFQKSSPPRTNHAEVEEEEHGDIIFQIMSP